MGGRKVVSVDVRIIAATNKDLTTLVAEGKFREDLYYRLNVVPISIPSLRERRDDIPILVKSFAARYNKKYGTYKNLTAELVAYLVEQPWKGNVRELENLISYNFV